MIETICYNQEDGGPLEREMDSYHSYLKRIRKMKNRMIERRVY
jgi:hypothetical protein